jgi:hypothetical protein
VAIAGGGGADLEVLAHREPAEDAVLLRHVAETEAHALVGRQLGGVLVVEADLAGVRGHLADDRLHQRGLAGAVAAEHGHRAAPRRRQAHAEQHLAAVVGRAHVADLENRVRHA